MDSNNLDDNQQYDLITIMKAHSQAEWEANASSPKYLLDTSFRRIVWITCSNFNLCTFGVPGYACRLIEYYMGARVRSFMSQHPHNNSWNNFRQGFVRRLPIIMSGAIVVSSQLHHDQPANSIIVSEFFVGIGLSNVTVENINNVVNEILQVNDSYFPVWTTIRIAELLAQYVGIPANMASFLKTLANKADLMAWQLTTDMGQIFFSIVLGGCRILSLHLAAGTVYATAKFNNYDMSSILSQLATLVDAPDLYLTRMADFILQYYNQDQDDF